MNHKETTTFNPFINQAYDKLLCPGNGALFNRPTDKEEPSGIGC
jgi:hypothetical protein